MIFFPLTNPGVAEGVGKTSLASPLADGPKKKWLVQISFSSSLVPVITKITTLNVSLKNATIFLALFIPFMCYSKMGVFLGGKTYSGKFSRNSAKRVVRFSSVK